MQQTHSSYLIVYEWEFEKYTNISKFGKYAKYQVNFRKLCNIGHN